MDDPTFEFSRFRRGRLVVDTRVTRFRDWRHYCFRLVYWQVTAALGLAAAEVEAAAGQTGLTGLTASAVQLTIWRQSSSNQRSGRLWVSPTWVSQSEPPTTLGERI